MNFIRDLIERKGKVKEKHLYLCGVKGCIGGDILCKK